MVRSKQLIMKRLTFSWLLSVNGIRYPEGDALFMKQLDLDQLRYPLNDYGRAIRPEIYRNLGKVRSVFSPNGAIEFVIGSNESPQLVARLETAFQVAGGFFENAFTFNNRIRVQVEHGTYCEEGKLCERDVVFIGTCRPFVHELIGPSGGLTKYPYSLYKQWGLKREPKRTSEYDMFMYISAKEDFLYPDQYGVYKEGHVSDLLEVMIHELLHGLGILSDVYFDYSKTSYNYKGPSMTHTPLEAHETTKFNFYSSLFETYLYYSYNGYEFSLHNLTRSMDYKGKDGQHFIGNIKHLPQIQTIDWLLNHHKSTYFKTKGGQAIFVETNLPTTRSGAPSVIWIRHPTGAPKTIS